MIEEWAGLGMCFRTGRDAQLGEAVATSESTAATVSAAAAAAATTTAATAGDADTEIKLLVYSSCIHALFF